MAYFPSQQTIRTAVRSRSSFDFSHDHITTSDFFKLKVLFCKELIPQDSVNLHMETFCRLLDLAAPTFADIRVQSRAFFVPMRTIMEGWNEFIIQAPYYGANGQSIINNTPVVTNEVLIQLFRTVQYDLTRVVTEEQADFELYVPGAPTPSSYLKLTNKGRWFYDILNSLRYKINWCTSDTTAMSALPLLAFFRIYCDYYSNPQYNYTADIQKLFRGIDRQLSAADLSPLIDKVYRGVFDDDYFVSAWDNPTGLHDIPNVGVISDQNIKPGQAGTSVTFSSTIADTSPKLTGYTGAGVNSPSPNNVTQFILDSLKAMTNYVKRLGVSGTRAVDRMMSEYGVKLDEAQLMRSVYLGSASQPVQVSDVMSTADTDGAPLGSFAGKGVSFGEGLNINFNVGDNASEFGYLMVISTIVPRTGYYQGRGRELFHTSPIDFFHGEFDNIGAQAIRKDELFSMYRDGLAYYNGTSSSGPSKVFGFSPRYSEYKMQLDNLSGDFCVPSLNGDGLMESMHLMRELESFAGDGYDDMNPHNLDFTMGDIQSGRYGFDRIFNNQNNTADHFLCVHHFNIKATRNMTSISDTFDIEGGREVQMPFNGTKLN